MEELESDDVVVAELDVLVSNELANLQSQLVMLQQPLRPNWRPYDTDRAGAKAQFKPHARRLEISLPLDTDNENYGDCDEPHKKIKSLDLRSTAVEDTGVAYAVGVVRGNQLVLMPVDYSLQLRPNMSYLNVEATKKKDGNESEGEAEDEEAQQIEVTVKKRETERQQQARLKSYSYLQQEEEQEPWISLQMAPPDSAPADAIWHAMLSAPEAAAATAAAANRSSGTAAAVQQRLVSDTLSRQEYLKSFVPNSNVSQVGVLGGGFIGGNTAANGTAAAVDPSSAAVAAGFSAGAAAAAAGGPPDITVTSEMTELVSKVIQMVMTRFPVCSMANIRNALQSQQNAAVKQAALLTDYQLDQLLLGTGHVLIIKKMFVAKTGTNAQTESLRKVVIQLLQDKATLRKNDVVSAAETAGLPKPNEGQYNKVMRELCRNNGSHWTIKTTAEV